MSRLKFISEICWYYNLKAAVFEPHLLWMCIDFHVATATWLVQVAMEDERTEFMPVEFPLPTEIPKSLSYIPEFVMSNISSFLFALAMLNEGILEVNNLFYLRSYNVFLCAVLPCHHN